MMFRVNGAPLYARGGNKIPMELLDGRMTAVAHRRLVQSAAEGNFGIIITMIIIAITRNE